MCLDVLAGYPINMKSYSTTDHGVYGIQTYGSAAPHEMTLDPGASHKGPSPLNTDIEHVYDAANTLAR